MSDDILAKVQEALAVCDTLKADTDNECFEWAAVVESPTLLQPPNIAAVTWNDIAALAERCAEAEATNANNLGLLEIIEQVGVERDRLAAIVAQFQDFVARERASRDAIGKGGQQVNGYAPSINPSVLIELERIIRNAPDVAANYARVEAENNRLAAELAAEREANSDNIAELHRADAELGAEREAHARTKAELAASKRFCGEQAVAVETLQGQLAAAEKHVEIVCGARDEIHAMHVSALKRAKGILRDLRAWLNSAYCEPEVMAKLNDLEATHADDRR